MNFLNESSFHPDLPADLTDRLDANLAGFRNLLGAAPDLIVREFAILAEKPHPAAVIYIENLVVINRIDEEIIKPLITKTPPLFFQGLTPYQRAVHFQSLLASATANRLERSFNGITAAIFSGETALLIDGVNEALVLNTRGWAQRAIGAPETEVTVRGPRESFVETLGTNLALLRRRISHPDLRVETRLVGEKTRTAVNLVYLKGVADGKVIEEVGTRLARLRIDGIRGAGYLEQLIGDAPLSPFSTVAYSERPDVVAAKILEGRVAILIDGNPEVLTVPALFMESFQNPDDYNFHPYYAALIRLIRWIAFGFSMLGPAIYIALTSFNQELIPTPLFINLATGSTGTPYPVFVEVIIMGLLFEIFREAGIRLPRPYGTGITFVLALVMAQASVTIGLAGEATVAIVALTAIASLIVPNQANPSILIRLALAILAGFLGFYGILLGLLYLLAHLAGLRSCGVPYLAPFAPFNPGDFKQDALLRSPIWAMIHRPRTIGPDDPKRQTESSKPGPKKNPGSR